MSIRRSATLMVAIAILAALIAVVLVALPVGAQEEKTRTPVIRAQARTTSVPNFGVPCKNTLMVERLPRMCG